MFGIYGRKGTLRVGADGDLVVIDPNGSWTVRSEDLFYKQGWSALEGETLNGRIEQTVVRGRVVLRQGRDQGSSRGSASSSCPRAIPRVRETLTRKVTVAA